MPELKTDISNVWRKDLEQTRQEGLTASEGFKKEETTDGETVKKRKTESESLSQDV